LCLEPGNAASRTGALAAEQFANDLPLGLGVGHAAQGGHKLLDCVYHDQLNA
jgi:hypothetical protein